MTLSDVALRLTRFCERFIPSAFTIACLLTLLVFVLGVTAGQASFFAVLRAWGDGFWTLLSFGMQMCLIVFAGYMVAVAPPVRAGLEWLAERPRTATGAVVATALFSMLIAWFHWGLGLIASAVMVGYMARRHPDADYRLLVAVSYFGLGATWHAGPSGSVPLLLATPNNFLIQGGVLNELVDIGRTLFMPYNLIFTGVVMATLTILAAWLHPPPEQRITIEAAAAEALTRYHPPARPEQPTVAQRLEHSVWVNLLVGALGLGWLIQHIVQPGPEAGGLNLDLVNFVFLIAAIVLHLKPAALGQAAQQGSQHLHGIVLQFPLYAGMFGVIKNTQLARRIAHAFVAVASPRTFPLITFWYSGVLNYFVPSGGSKWAIEAPYLIEAGQRLGVDIERVAMAYAYGDMSTNLIQPFWAIPLLSVAQLHFNDILGFETIAFAAYALLASVGLIVFF